jgi:hypothetical protein
MAVPNRPPFCQVLPPDMQAVARPLACKLSWPDRRNLTAISQNAKSNNDLNFFLQKNKKCTMF